MSDPKDSFNRKVPVDEMVERLRNHRSTSGESQPVGFEVVGEGEDQTVVEVRRRRVRRSKQPKRAKEKRQKFTRFVLSIGIIPVGILIAVIYFSAIAHYQSAGFREDLTSRLSDKFESDFQFRSLVIKGTAITCPHLSITPLEGDIVRNAQFYLMKADMDSESFFSKDWHITALASEQLDLHLHPPIGGRTLGGWPSPDSAKAMRMAGFGLTSKPEKFLLGASHIEQTNIYWPAAAEEAEEGSEDKIFEGVSITTNSIGDSSATLELSKGLFSIPRWPSLELTRAEVELAPDGIEIISSRFGRAFEGDDSGRASITGTIGLSGDHAVALEARVEHMDISGLMIPTWKDRIRGSVTADAKITVQLSKYQSELLEGSLTIRNAALANIPNITALSTFAEEVKLQRLEFETLKASFRRTSSYLEIYNIDGDVTDLFAIRGQLRIDRDDKLSGKLEIGLGERVLESREYGRPAFFSAPDENGYCWTPVELGGKLRDIDDDLSDRFMQERDLMKSKSRARFPTFTPNATSFGNLPLSGD
ncbi:MAG: hypothetical protein AAGJ79_02835 [Verrucomicrobiota bacterium]